MNHPSLRAGAGGRLAVAPSDGLASSSLCRHLLALGGLWAPPRRPPQPGFAPDMTRLVPPAPQAMPRSRRSPASTRRAAMRRSWPRRRRQGRRELPRHQRSLPAAARQQAEDPGAESGRLLDLPRPPVGAQWDFHTQTLGADQVWAPAPAGPGLKGTGVRVAVLDTGVNDQPDTSTRPRQDQSRGRLEGLRRNKPQPYDDNGHGTHVAGIVLGSGATRHKTGGACSPASRRTPTRGGEGAGRERLRAA